MCCNVFGIIKNKYPGAIRIALITTNIAMIWFSSLGKILYVSQNSKAPIINITTKLICMRILTLYQDFAIFPNFGTRPSEGIATSPIMASVKIKLTEKLSMIFPFIQSQLNKKVVKCSIPVCELIWVSYVYRFFCQFCQFFNWFFWFFLYNSSYLNSIIYAYHHLERKWSSSRREKMRDTESDQYVWSRYYFHARDQVNSW